MCILGGIKIKVWCLKGKEIEGWGWEKAMGGDHHWDVICIYEQVIRKATVLHNQYMLVKKDNEKA